MPGLFDIAGNVETQLIVGYRETPFPLDFRPPAALAADVAETQACDLQR